MSAIFKKQHGMDIVGQGGKIILFTLPALVAAIVIHRYLPQVARLPVDPHTLRPLGYLLLTPGVGLWAVAVVQLLAGFSQGRLVTTGAYGVVRNPIYASAALFILPAIALLTSTWVYLVTSIFLYVGVSLFIGKEEQQLTEAFGAAYQSYLTQVDRLVPFWRPRYRAGRGDL